MNKTRQNMIDELSDVFFHNLSDCGFKEMVIADGFKGYNNYADDELLTEYNNYMGVEEVTA